MRAKTLDKTLGPGKKPGSMKPKVKKPPSISK
jgi:hypothetical protein